MKVIVLHGIDTKKLYNRLTVFINEAKKRGWEISDFDLNKINNYGLFSQSYLFVMRDYKDLNLKDLEKVKDIEGNLVIYHEGKITKDFLENLKPDKIETFELPQKIWTFLNRITVSGFHEIIKTEAPEYILSMIAWKLKQNYLKNPNNENAGLIMKFANLDVISKTSKTSLINLLDLFIAKYLQ